MPQRISPDASSTIRLLLPRTGEQIVDLKPLAFENPRGEVRSQEISLLPKSDWFRQSDEPLATAAFELDCGISIPAGAAGGKVLLLLECSGTEHLPTSCSCQIDGRGAALQETSSAAHIGDIGGATSAWRRLQPYMSHWTWYICDLASGPASAKFSGMFPYGRCKMGLWGLGGLGPRPTRDARPNRVPGTGNAAIPRPVEAPRDLRVAAPAPHRKLTSLSWVRSNLCRMSSNFLPPYCSEAASSF